MPSVSKERGLTEARGTARANKIKRRQGGLNLIQLEIFAICIVTFFLVFTALGAVECSNDAATSELSER